MNSRHNYGIDSQKRDLIQLLSLMREQKYGCESTEIISEGMIMHMLKLLKSVKQIENPYSIHSLELLYQEFSKQMGEILFSVDELIAEGWIVVCVEQWHLNVGKRSDYEEYGNIDIPSNFIYCERKLGMWLSTQRQAYRGNPNYHITEERIVFLNKLGMDWKEKVSDY